MTQKLALEPVVILADGTFYFGYIVQGTETNTVVKLYNACYVDAMFAGGLLNLVTKGPKKGLDIYGLFPWFVVREIARIVGVSPEAERKWVESIHIGEK